MLPRQLYITNLWFIQPTTGDEYAQPVLKKIYIKHKFAALAKNRTLATLIRYLLCFQNVCPDNNVWPATEAQPNL